MTLRQLKRTFLSELNAIYPNTEIESFFYLLVESILNLKRVDIALNIDNDIDISPKFHEAINALVKQKPIQYILGNTEFFGLYFEVNESVLIPRPETEELVHWICTDYIENSKQINLIDIGTGSGCIAISLAKKIANIQVTALDVSESALQIAKKNAQINEVNVQFVTENILHPISNKLNSKFDIIVSNPPYIRELEKKEIQKNVLDNEPHLALFVTDKNPLLFYNAIANFALKHLRATGTLYLEINQYLGKETINLLKNKGFNRTELKQDIFGADRMIKCTF